MKTILLYEYYIIGIKKNEPFPPTTVSKRFFDEDDEQANKFCYEIYQKNNLDIWVLYKRENLLDEWRLVKWKSQNKILQPLKME